MRAISIKVKRLRVKNFRNYALEDVNFIEGRNIIVGKNAQGKTNLLEAIEYAARGKSYRASSDNELIRKNTDGFEIDVEFEDVMGEKNISVKVLKSAGQVLKSGQSALSKQVTVNGSTYRSTRKLNGNLTSVSFKSEDLNLVRSGPKYRRDWIDSIASSLSRTFSQDLSKFNKSITQRNRLLKELCEKGGLNDSDRALMKVFNEQAALLGGKVIRVRLDVLESLLPHAIDELKKFSGGEELLAVDYKLKGLEETSGDPINTLDEKGIAKALYRLFQSRFQEEIIRKQTLAGPHRDDLSLLINGEDSTIYASQGQQRSLVLALKLAELIVVQNHIMESPILLLDDVLAELDVTRQSFLMASCDKEMQTLITTTHIDSFEKKWMTDARFIEIDSGKTKIEGLSTIS